MTSHSENEAFKKNKTKQNTSLSQCTVHGNISRTRNQFYSKKKNRGYKVKTKQRLPFGKISFSSL